MLLITATEFKNNMGKYLDIIRIKQEDILITKNGKNIAKLSSTQKDKVESIKSLFGLIPNDSPTLKQIREERLARHETTN